MLEKSVDLSKNVVLTTRTHIRHCIRLSSSQYKNKQNWRFVVPPTLATVLLSEDRTTESSTQHKENKLLKFGPPSLRNCGTTVELDLGFFPTSLEADCRLNHSSTDQTCVCAPTGQATPRDPLSRFYLKVQAERAPTKRCLPVSRYAYR